MKRILRNAVLWLCAPIAAGAVAFAAPDVSPYERRGRAVDAQPSDKGEQIQNVSCANCHDLRPIQIQALDSEGWMGVVTAMIDRGAEVKAEDIPILVEFLVANHGPLPDGAGKRVLLNTCTVCHDLKRVKQTAAGKEEWEQTLSQMLNEGAMLSDQDFPVLLNYLVRNFRPAE